MALDYRVHTLGCLLLVFCTPRATHTQPRADLAITHVRIVYGDGRAAADATIVVTAGRITSIAGSDKPVDAALRIDGTNRTVIPGLIDAHVHADDSTFSGFLRHGVTTIRDLHNDPAYILSLPADSFDRPRIIAAGAELDEPSPARPHVMTITSRTTARAAVRRNLDRGARVVTSAAHVQPAMLCAMVAEAQARAVPVAAHLGVTNARQAADCGVNSIEHLTGISEAVSVDTDARQRIVSYLIGRRVTIVPTLVRHEKEFARSMPDLQSFVAMYDRLGGTVVAGTDAAHPVVAAGASLHRELELYVNAGLSPAAALKTATSSAAALLGISDLVGTIQVGKVADLVLLDGDPLRDIRLTRRIWKVIRMGIVVYEQ